MRLAENKLSTLEPRAELARQLEIEIAGLKADINRIRAENEILADANELQAKIIKSRSNSPAFGLCQQDRSTSPPPPPPPPPAQREVTFHETVEHRSRSQSPCGDYVHEHRTVTTHRSASPPARSAQTRVNCSCGCGGVRGCGRGGGLSFTSFSGINKFEDAFLPPRLCIV